MEHWTCPNVCHGEQKLSSILTAFDGSASNFKLKVLGKKWKEKKTQRLHLLPRPWFFVWSRTKSQEVEAEKEGEKMRRVGDREWRSLSNEKTLCWTKNFSTTIQMCLPNAWVIHYRRSCGATMGPRNEWCYLAPDVIFLIRLIPWPCIPLLIRK